MSEASTDELSLVDQAQEGGPSLSPSPGQDLVIEDPAPEESTVSASTPAPAPAPAKSATSEAAQEIVSEVKSLVTEIFEVTGQKVEVNDPVVVAALMHSQIIKRAGNEAAAAIDQAVKSGIEQLKRETRASNDAQAQMVASATNGMSQALKASAAASDAIEKKTREAFEKIAAATNAAVSTAKVNAELQVLAVVDRAMTNIVNGNQNMLKGKLAVQLGGFALVVVCAAMAVGWYIKPAAKQTTGQAVPQAMSEADIKSLNVGRDMQRIWSQLDPETRETIRQKIQGR